MMAKAAKNRVGLLQNEKKKKKPLRRIKNKTKKILSEAQFE